MQTYGDYPDHHERRREAHLAEIRHTPDWEQVMRHSDSYPGRPERIQDGNFAGLKASFTARAGRRTAPWNMRETQAESIAERIQEHGTVAWAAYHRVELPDDAPRPRSATDRRASMPSDERRALDEKIAARRASKKRNG